MNTKNFILNHVHHAHSCTPAEHSLLPHYIEMAEAFARISSMCVFLIDYTNGTIPYVSERMVDAESRLQMLQAPDSFFEDCTKPGELLKMAEANKAFFKLIHSQPREQRKNHTLSFNYNLRMNGVFLHIFRHVTPFAFTAEGEMWLALCILMPAGNAKLGDTIITGPNHTFYIYNYQTHHYELKTKVELSPMEHSLLLLSAQGCDTEQAAEKTARSTHSVKAYKKGLFNKLNASNITESLATANNYFLL